MSMPPDLDPHLDPELAGVALDFANEMSYGDYLHLDAVLGAQHPLSPE